MAKLKGKLLARPTAFSLVEIVLAIGIVAFALMAVVGLLPVGLRLAGDSEDETRAANILNAVVADRRATPLGLPSQIFKVEALTNASVLPTTNYFGITDDGKYCAQDMQNARYRVSYALIPPANGGKNSYLSWLRVSWPALNTNSPEALETVAAYPTFAAP